MDNDAGDRGGACCRAVLLLSCPKSDFDAEVPNLFLGEDAKDDGCEGVDDAGFGEFAPFNLRKSEMSGSFFEGHRLASSLAVSSLELVSESDSTIHLADNRAFSNGRADDCGRTLGDAETGVLSLGMGDDLPIAWGGTSLPGRDGVPASPPLSFPLALALAALVAAAIAKLGLTGLATCNGTLPGGIESDGCSGTGKCTELRFFADSSCACLN